MPHSPTEPGERLVDDGATSDERTWALIMHLSIIAIIAGIPPVIPPLIMWLIKRESSAFINDHGKEAINFQLSFVLYGAIAFVVGVITCLGVILLPLVGVLGIIVGVLAGTAANRGEYYRYPATIRFIT